MTVLLLVKTPSLQNLTLHSPLKEQKQAGVIRRSGDQHLRRLSQLAAHPKRRKEADPALYDRQAVEANLGALSNR
jgi:hypothetical protein